MLKIRLTRLGSTHNPHYRVVVAEARSRRDGRPVDTIGHYHPTTKNKELVLDVAAYEKWIKHGAQPTDTARALYRRAKKRAAAAPEAAASTEAAVVS
jgi:small subunit ribosomal protein S16